VRSSIKRFFGWRSHDEFALTTPKIVLGPVPILPDEADTGSTPSGRVGFAAAMLNEMVITGGIAFGVSSRKIWGSEMLLALSGLVLDWP